MQLPHLPGNDFTHEYQPDMKKLTVRGAKTFPRQILDLADDIEILDLSFGELSALPADFGRLHKLKVIFLSYTNFTEVPPVLAQCSALSMIGMRSCKIATFAPGSLPAGIEAITLTENQLTSIPADIGRYKQLKKLMLTGNRLQDLPRELLQCPRLDTIRIAVNDFEQAPEWVLQLPKLTWYSDAGNPFRSTNDTPSAKLPAISWNELQLGEKIGESAKNAVYRGRDPAGTEIAIKVYGSGVTTDGLPADEIRALLAAGRHPHLTSALATITDIPDDKQGLIMPLIRPEFTAPGQPPDLKTHTRDTFTPGQTFTLTFAVRLLCDIAAALEHVHRSGVMHGDVYAHNILADKTGHAYLCDFGGASLYDPAKSDARQRVDVRAFGILAEDILSRCPEKGPTYDKLHDLQRVCLAKKPTERPLFAEISRVLHKTYKITNGALMCACGS